MESIQPPVSSPENHQSLSEVSQNNHENHQENRSLNIDLNIDREKIENLTANFRSKLLKMVEKSKILPEQKLCIEKGLRKLLPDLVVPDHPPYAWMIHRAIKELNEVGGSNEEAISSFIKRDQQNLPWAHATILQRHLKQLCEMREVVLTSENRYMLNLSPPKSDYSRVPSPEKNFKRQKKNMLKRHKRKRRKNSKRQEEEESDEISEDFETTEGVGGIETEIQWIENQRRTQKSRRARVTNNNESAKGKEKIGVTEETFKEADLKVSESNKTQEEFNETPQEELGEAPPTQEEVIEKLHEKAKMIEPQQQEMVEATKGEREKVIDITQEGGQVIKTHNQLKQKARPNSERGRSLKQKRRLGRPPKIKIVEVSEMPRVKRLPGRPPKNRIIGIGTSSGPKEGDQTDIEPEETPIGNELVPYIGPNEAQEEAIQVNQVNSQVKRRGRPPKIIDVESSMGSNTAKEKSNEVHNQLEENRTRPSRKKRGRPPKRFVVETNLGIKEAENLDEDENLLATDEVNVIQVPMERICIAD